MIMVRWGTSYTQISDQVLPRFIYLVVTVLRNYWSRGIEFDFGWGFTELKGPVWSWQRYALHWGPF